MGDAPQRVKEAPMNVVSQLPENWRYMSEQCLDSQHDDCDGWWWENGSFIGQSRPCECGCSHLAEQLRNLERKRILNQTIARILCDNE